MPHLSRYKLSSDERSRLSDQLVAAVLRLRDGRGLDAFFDDLFSPTERAMIGKRLMIMVLLKRGHSFMDISRALKVSQGTISSMSERFQRGSRDLGSVLDALERRQNFGTLMERWSRPSAGTARRLPQRSGSSPRDRKPRGTAEGMVETPVGDG